MFFMTVQATVYANIPHTLPGAHSHAMREHQQRALAAGMDGHLSKPVDLATIKEKLLQYLVFPEGNSRRA